MSPRAPRRGRKAVSASRHVGVIDIGSNSVRLVVFDAVSRTPQPIFNEKVLCSLGRGLEASGRLNREGMELALLNLRRFASLAAAMGVGRLEAMATAAVRDAADGPEFVAAVRRRAGLDVRVLSGAEEARLSALGVVSGMPAADGLMGDLGGGSLELVALNGGRLGRHATLPFGPLRLADATASGVKPNEIIDEALAGLTWLDRVEGRSFYAVGGAWRAIARLHMAHVDYPLRVIHHYSLPRDQAEDFLDLIAHLSRDSLERISRIPRRRVEALPVAALVLERILARARPRRLVFSALGLREGCLYAALPPALRRRDPLIAAASDMAARSARFALDGRRLHGWIEELFADTTAEARRLHLAACLLADIAWGEHPDYRAELAFLRVLRLPLTGIDHAGRAWIALAVFARYAGSSAAEVMRPAIHLLDEERRREAGRLGLALRLAFTLSGGAPKILRHVALVPGAKNLKLVLKKSARALIGESVERRLAALAEAFDKAPLIVATET
ncbi:MAG: Ppx/GppA phosphatase family protein [Pseudomonadota bacterium]